jgi:hypothetical protein
MTSSFLQRLGRRGSGKEIERAQRFKVKEVERYLEAEGAEQESRRKDEECHCFRSRVHGTNCSASSSK